MNAATSPIVRLLMSASLLSVRLLLLGVHLGVEEGGVALDDLGADDLHGGGQ